MSSGEGSACKRYAPRCLSVALLDLDSDVPDEVAILWIPLDATPVTPAHDILAFRRRAVRVPLEDRDLRRGQGCERRLLKCPNRKARTIVSSVSSWCSVRCVFVASVETMVITPFGGLSIHVSEQHNKISLS